METLKECRTHKKSNTIVKYLKQYLDNASTELCKASRRINTLIEREQTRLNFLDRSYEECWAYPDYEEKSEKYSDLIFECQKEIEQMKEMKDIIDKSVEINTNISDIVYDFFGKKGLS